MAAPMAAHPDVKSHRPLLSSRPTAGSHKLDGGPPNGRRRPSQRPTATIPRADGDHPNGPRRPPQGPTATIPRADGDLPKGRRLPPQRPTATTPRADGDHPKGRRRPPQRPTAATPKADGCHPKGRRRPLQRPTATIPRADGGYPKGVWVVTSQYTASSHEPVRRSPKPAHEPHIIPYGTCVSSLNRGFALTTTCDPLSIPTYHALIELETKMISNTYRFFSQLAHGSGIARMLELTPGERSLFSYSGYLEHRKDTQAATTFRFSSGHYLSDR
jgi:hypothetical protein